MTPVSAIVVQRLGRSTQPGDRSEAPEVDLGVASALAGDDTALDRMSARELHDAYHELRRNEHVSWPCPCQRCAAGREPIRVSIQPHGPTMFEVLRLVWDRRRHGKPISHEQARAELIAER